MNSMSRHLLSRRVGIHSFALISAVFYLMAYYSVSNFLPSAIPVHHDDYTNYSSAAGGLAWSWIRPLSTWLISVFSSLGPDWLIWAVRIFTATYLFLCWKILIEVIQPVVFKTAISWKGLFAFPLVYLVQYLLSAMLLSVFVERLDIPQSIAPLTVIVLTIPVTFVLTRWLLRRS